MGSFLICTVHQLATGVYALICATWLVIFATWLMIFMFIKKIVVVKLVCLQVLFHLEVSSATCCTK